MITIGLHFGTYLSEVYRGALEGVSKTQWEACRALNFSTIYTYRRIVLPQALKTALPALTNQAIGLLQNTSLLALLGLVELLGISRSIMANPLFIGKYMEIYFWVALIKPSMASFKGLNQSPC